MRIVEAAGFDVVIVETVGVGQSETAVAEMTDIFLLLLLPGGGDELQGIKRGIVELADLIVVNKADGEMEAAAGRTVAEYQNALRLLRPRSSRWAPVVASCSALTGAGIGAAWEAILAHRDHITGLDLAGDEAAWPGTSFVEHFRRGRDAGLRITVHAGEAAGPDSVWQAIRELGAERLGHAVRAREDLELVDYLREHRIGIESCLTSNVQTSTVSSLAAHPLRWFLEQGLLATINTDDPSISGIDLEHELAVAAPAAGLAPEQICGAQDNALEIAFLTPEERSALAAS